MKTRDILCDAGSFISLTSACLDQLLYFFSEKYHIRFIIPPSVEYEVIERPMKSNLKKYLFSAIRIKDAIDDGVIAVVDADVRDDMRKTMEAANKLFYMRGKPLHLIHKGESEMLALAGKLDIDYILIDERTTRMLIEAPFRLKEHLQDEFHTNVMINKKNLLWLSEHLSALQALRSSELVMLAYESGYFKRFEKMQKRAIESALYKTKFSGCSIGFDEIREYLSKVK